MWTWQAAAARVAGYDRGGQVWTKQPSWGCDQLGDDLPKELCGGCRHPQVWMGSLKGAPHRAGSMSEYSGLCRCVLKPKAE